MEYYDVLSRCKLFRDIDESGIEAMLKCLDSRVCGYTKNDIILLEGAPVTKVGIVLSGSVHIIKEDMNGDRVIIARAAPGDLFGEALSFAGVKESPISVAAGSNAVILLIDFGRILKTCSNLCTFHSKLIENMLFVIANKNIRLQSRLDIISRKTLRQKVLSYIKSQLKKDERVISLPFSREELADYLCADRSALSHELSRMKKDGLIDYYKNSFKLLKSE